MNAQVLVLNQNYEPLNICNIRRALVLVIMGKAEVLEQNGLVLHTIDRDFRAPSVIRLSALVKRPRPQVKLTRREVQCALEATCSGVRQRPIALRRVGRRSDRPHSSSRSASCAGAISVSQP